MDKSMRIPMNLQLFAESGGDPAGDDSGSGASGNQQTQNNQQTGQSFQFDYEKLAGLLARIRNHLPEPYIVWQYFEEAVV